MKQVMKYFVAVFMFLFPIAFLPTAIDAYGFGKNWMVLVYGLVGLALWLINLLLERKNNFKFSRIWLLPVILAVWAGFLWTRETAGVQMNSIMNVGGIGTILSVVIWSFLWMQTKDAENEKIQWNFLTGAGLLTALSSLVVFLLPSSKLPINWPANNPIVSINASWSLTGSLLAEAALMLFLMLEWAKRLMVKLKGKGDAYVKEASMMAVFTLIFLLSVYKIIKAGWIALDGTSAWVIATETFKRSPIFGIGPGNFIQAFNLFRPTSYNLTAYWTNAFGISSNGILQVWTELGIVGLIVMLVFVWLVIKAKKNFDWVRIMLATLIFLFTPLNLVTLMLLIWIVTTYLAEVYEVKLVFKLGNGDFNAAPWLVAGIGGLSLLYSFIPVGFINGSGWIIRIPVGDYFMRAALVAAAKNDGGGTYNLQIKAIGYNPTNADYRRMYSQTNLALAKTLLSNANVTDDDKQKAAVLIQQAVREGKAAVALDGNNPVYWSNLASIYQDLIGVVDGSADWAYQAYSQAVALDPVNPNLGLNLGGLLYAAQRYDDADRVFEQVVTDKPDFANGWYNWAYAAKQNGRLDVAVQRLTQAVNLVPKDSGDYAKASQELAAWNAELTTALEKQKQAQQPSPTPTPIKPETLTAPQPQPTVGKEEKVNIPADQLQPPVVTPMPTVTAAPTPSVGK